MAHHKKTAGNPDDFILPDLGEGVHEAELIKWRVEVGQAVREHDVLAEMETDKALVEVPSPRDGVIAALHGAPGEILKVGNALVTFAGSGAGASSAPKPAPSQPAAETRAAVSRQNGTADAGAGCDMGAQIAAGTSANGAAREDAGTVVGSVGGAIGGMSATPGKALATPAVRRLARDLGVEIDTVAGTGLGGRVTEKDIRAAATGGPAARAGGSAARTSAPTLRPAAPLPPATRPGSPASVVPMDLEHPHAELVADGAGLAPAARRPAPQPTPRTPASTPAGVPAGADSVRIPFRGVRRTIANRLRTSVNQAVHFNVMDEADVTALDGLRRRLAAASGEKVSFLPFVASAICRVLTQDAFRVLNSTVDDPSEEIIQHRAVHMGIATDTDNGLMVPVIRDCDALGVLEIGRHIAHAAAGARDRSIPRESLLGSTFTISNVGSHAGRFATPIINYPEVGILAVGRGREGMVVHKGTFRVGQLLPLSLACDHRVVDGATAALALAEIIRLLQDPEQLLAPARA